jgi:hypothetical protein
VVVVSPEHDYDRAGLACPHLVADAREPIEDIGALEPARYPTLDLAGRDRPVSRHGPQERLTGDDHERVTRDPDPELALRREPLPLQRRGGCVVDVRLLWSGRDDDRSIDAVVARAAEHRLESAAGSVE